MEATNETYTTAELAAILSISRKNVWLRGLKENWAFVEKPNRLGGNVYPYSGTPLIIEMSRLPFKVQENIMRTVEYGLPSFAGAAIDAGGIGASLAEAARQEWGPELIHEIKLSESWYSTNFPPLKARFEDKGLIVPPDTHIRTDIRQIKVIKGLPKLDDVRVKTAEGQRHGDAAIALTLADYALRHAPDIAPWAPAFTTPSDTSRLLDQFNR